MRCEAVAGGFVNVAAVCYPIRVIVLRPGLVGGRGGTGGTKDPRNNCILRFDILSYIE